jgi:hypothetical protein
MSGSIKVLSSTLIGGNGILLIWIFIFPLNRPGNGDRIIFGLIGRTLTDGNHMATEPPVRIL